MGRELDGVVYDKLREMQEARRARRLEIVSGGMSFARAAEAVGVSKRTGKAWRNGRGGSPRRARPLEGRPDRRRGQQVGDRDTRGAHGPLHDTAPPAGRTRRRAGAGRHSKEDGPPARAHAELADVGPWKRARAPQEDRRRARHAGLLLRPALALVARHEREHNRPPSPALPERNRLECVPGRLPRRCRRGAQRQAAENARLHEAERAFREADGRVGGCSLVSGCCIHR